MNLKSVSTTGVAEQEKWDVPVDTGLPESVIEAVEEVQEHGADVAGGGPVDWLHGQGRGTSETLLKGISTSPDGQGNDQEHEPSNLGSETTADARGVKGVTQDCSSDNLCQVVQETVESPGAGGEAGKVDIVRLVCVEPIGGKKHREEEDNKGLEFDRFPQSDELRLPARVLHQDDTGAIWSNDI